MVYSRNGISCSHKKDEVLTHAATWMNLESMLSERSQSQKATDCMIPFLEISSCQGLRGAGNGACLLMGMGFLLGVMKMFGN